MFQLIVSVIAIALVAILAAASIYYGGSAFTSSNTKGAVAALINSGEQIAGANALYKVDNTVDVDTIDHLQPVYLAAAPTAPKFASGAWTITPAVTGTTPVAGFASIDLSTTNASTADQVCAEVVNQGGSDDRTGTSAAPSKVFGCVKVGGVAAFAYKM
ncbi:hypothetical protein ACVIGB_000405 [Bradyrhizobium sp. USDA 4341]